VDPAGTLAAGLAGLVEGEVLLHDPRPPTGRPTHVAEHLLAPLRRRGWQAEVPYPWLSLQTEDRAWAEAQWRACGLGPDPVILHPGSGSRDKCWPLPGFVELAARLSRAGHQPVLLRGPAETDGPSPDAPFPCLRPPGCLELAAALERARLFVGNDSGPGHLAAALGRPTLSLFGPTDPRQWRPAGPRGRVVQAPGGRLAALSVDAVHWAAVEALAAADEPSAGGGLGSHG
jgi:ADP-heptose:LPS heptosyltransferase